MDDFSDKKLTRDQERTATRDELILHNYRLVASRVNRWRDQGIDEDDLFQEGMVGLVTAAERFDPEKARFATYAILWIDNFIRRAVQRARAVNLPIYLQQEGEEEVPSFVSAGSGEEEFDLPDESADTVGIAETRSWQRRLRAAIEHLTERERFVVEAYYGLGGEEPLSVSYIAEALSLSKSMVTKIRRQAEEKLRVRG